MPTHATIVAFDILVFLSALLFLCALVTAALSKSVARSLCWYNLMIAGLVYSLSFGCIIGKQETADQPPLALCVTQAVLINAAPVLFVSTTSNLYIELYLILLRLRSGDFSSPNCRRSFWLVVTPWLLFIAVVVAELLIIFSGDRLHLVGRRPGAGFFCFSRNRLSSTIIEVILAIMYTGIVVPLQARLSFTIYRSPDALKRLVEADHQLFITLYLRLTLATLCTMLGLGLSLSAVVSKYIDINSMDLGFPIVGLILAILSTSQKDILRTWLFWRPSRRCSSILFKVPGSHEAGKEQISDKQ